MTKAERENLKAAITRRATKCATGEDLALMSKAAKTDPKLYAEINAEAMAPIYAEQQRKRDELEAAAEAEKVEAEKRRQDRAQQHHDNLIRAIDQRIAHHGVPTGAKRR